ncbi:MAG TPA: Rne/Rng family ribonuclease [Rickettsiales bacterium]|nr:Rne/Rng family ribonuclease [Rickettsiales bacterium]
MVLRLLIDSVHTEETRVAIVENGRINDFDFVTSAKKQLKGNIYLAKITRVEPSLQAAFVEYGGDKQGFLPFAEIHPDYYQIPVADRERLMKEVEAGEDAREENGASSEAAEESAAPAKAVTVKQEEPEPEEIFLKAEPEIIAHLHETPVAYSEAVTEAEVEAQAHGETPQPIEGPAVQQEVIPPSITEAAEAIEPSEGQEHSETAETEPQEAQEIETLASEEDAVRQSRSASFYRRYKIQEVIKRNQIVLVQVIKEERGNKGVSLTTFISLAGRYCVLMPNSPKGGGISRKISSGEDRRRLKEISSELKTARGMSAIIRTAGIDRTRGEIQRDYEYLVKLWETIREQTLSSSAPALIYEEGDIIKRTIRDLYTTDISEIIVAGENGYNQAKTFLNMLLPGDEVKVKSYQDNIPLFHAYNIEDQLNSMYDQSVKLRSGGYIVLNPTEALISIDVNSGRSTGERNIEETAAKTNLEAAAEIARQLRLRDLAGLIVIDFIDMADSRNRRAVERALRDALKMDRAKIQLGRISPFGLLEMSRQRLRPSISETSTITCPHCSGKGVVRSNSSIALQAIRALEKEAASKATTELKLTVTTAAALEMLNSRRDAISGIEQKYGVKIMIVADDSIPHGNFRIEKVKGGKRHNQPASGQTPVSMDHLTMEGIPLPPEEPTVNAEAGTEEETQQPHTAASGEDRPRRRRGGRGRRGGKNFAERNAERGNESVPANETQETTQVEGTESGTEDASGQAPKREERGGRRNRQRRWRDKRDGNRPENQNTGAEAAPHSEHSGASTHAAPVNHAPSAAPQPQQNSTVLPLDQQAPQDGKPKKGWWRRIVEAS